MPTYDYLCPANGRVVEVSHKMAEQLATWGELCRKAGIPLDGTPGKAKVERLITGGNVPRARSRPERAPLRHGPLRRAGVRWRRLLVRLTRVGTIRPPTADREPYPVSSPPKIGFVSLGCPKALVDSERILTQLEWRATTSCRPTRAPTSWW